MASTFWSLHPGLLYGIAFLLGCFAGVRCNLLLLFPMAGVWLPLLCYRDLPKHDFHRLLLAMGLFAMAWIYSASTQSLPAIDEATTKEMAAAAEEKSHTHLIRGQRLGSARFSIDKIQFIDMHGKQWLYHGKADYFSLEGKRIGKRIPCILRIGDKLHRPVANCSYAFQAALKESRGSKYTLIPNKIAPWKTISGTFSLAEIRYQAQQSLANYIRKAVTNRRSANFLVGIATGDFQDRQLSLEFSRFGLQHIMAISGFHFSILASILSLILSLFLPKSAASYFLIVFLSAYFIFLGPSPAVMRAWISCMIALCAVLARRKGSGLNSLGLGLLCVLIFDPALTVSLGFQFSFAATAAILLLYPACEALMQKIFPKRALTEAVQMNIWNQCGYISLSFFRQAISLGCAVNMVALPLTLFYFHTFPLLSLPYNLFFPFMVAISLFLLIIGGAFCLLLPPVGHMINALNSNYTHFMLQYTHHIPPALDLTLSTENFPIEVMVISFPLLFACGMWHVVYRHRQKGQNEDWAFL